MMQFRVLGVVTILFLVGDGSFVAGQTAAAFNQLSAEEAAAVDAAVAEQMKEQDVVGAAVGLIRRGEIVYLNGYGLADRERGRKADTLTIFNWASNSKPLCAFAAMQLVEQGKLDLDVDVRTYVPEFHDHGVKITMRDLLCHQSGIPHYTNGKITPNPQRDLLARPWRDPVHALDAFGASPLLFPPRTKTAYSSYAYILASAVVQRAGNKPFVAQVQERIARPRGMLSLQVDVATEDQQNWSVGYKKVNGELITSPEFANDWKHGAGAFKSNIADFARWARGLTNRRWLKPATYREMWRAQPLADGTPTTWGLGFMVERQNGLKVWHNGRQDESTSCLIIYPDAGHGIVILTNSGHAEPSKIAAAVYQALEK